MELIKKDGEEKEQLRLYGRKVTQFHIDIVIENLDRILTGELNTREVLALINKQALECNQTQLRDVGTVKRIMKIILKDRPEELEKYLKSLKHNIGRRTPRGVKRDTRVGSFSYRKNQEFIIMIIEEYLPRILAGEVTVKGLARELNSSDDTINGIIEEYYSQRGDEEGIKLFRAVKRENAGSSPEKRARAREMRKKVQESGRIVNNKTFITLPPEEQDRQIILKIRKEKLKEEKNSGRTAVVTEEYVIANVEKIKKYFREKNDLENGIINFTEQDIRCIIFSYPTIIGRTNELLDEKFKMLTSYAEIDEKTACGMIKGFPTIMGYSVNRTKAQLDLLHKENIVIHVITNPRGFIQSVQLMYALIQFAKERHKVDCLDEISTSNIFMSGSTLKRLYNVTIDELKERYPYIEGTEKDDTDDEQMVISGEDIGRATFRGLSKIELDEAELVLDEITKNHRRENDDISI